MRLQTDHRGSRWQACRAFEGEREAIARLEVIAWQALQDGRKSPVTQDAGPGFSDPGHAVSVQWLQTRQRRQAAQRCHWPCSCYPNHALGQADDWMAEIYERWVAAHAVIILAPTYRYPSPSPLKLMIDRMVCANGGNPDPTTTHGKKVAEAKRLEQQGWDHAEPVAGLGNRRGGARRAALAVVCGHRRTAG